MLFFKKKEPAQPKTNYYNVAGLSYYLDNLRSVGTERPKFKLSDDQLVKKVTGKRAYKYGFPEEPVQLIPEPTNPHDKNAIQIILAGALIGYVPSDKCAEVRMIMQKHTIQKITVFISGGEHKLVENGKITLIDEPYQGELRIYYV